MHHKTNIKSNNVCFNDFEGENTFPQTTLSSIHCMLENMTSLSKEIFSFLF